jgi:acetylornithine deacetylase
MNLSSLEKKVSERVVRMKEDIVQTLQALVRIPSLVGQETKAQAYMDRLYRSLNLEVTSLFPDLEKVKTHPAFIDTEMSYEGRPNIIGGLAGDGAGRSLILNGHMDVVSPEPVSGWKYDPWGGQVEGERLYGRGAGDMKAGLVANYFALKAILDEGVRPKGAVTLQSVIDEEAGGAGGTLALLMQGSRADAMICTEPHNLNLTISHSGVNYFRVKVQGKISHAALAHLGVNAIGKMYLIYQALIDLDEKRAREIRFPLFEKGSGRSCHLSIGTLKAGDWPSNVAGSAEMECRIGYVPGEKMGDIKHLVERTVGETGEKDPWLKEHPPKVEWFGWQTEPWYQDPQHPFVQTLKGALESTLGKNPEIIGRAGGIDSRFAQYFNMVSACTGPKAGGIHGFDEYVEIPSVIQVTQALATAILRWCGVKE